MYGSSGFSRPLQNLLQWLLSWLPKFFFVNADPFTELVFMIKALAVSQIERKAQADLSPLREKHTFERETC